jgi:hypothetical protein
MAKKAARKATGRRTTPSNKKKGAGARASARSGAGSRRTAKAKRNTGRKTAGAKTPKGKARARGKAGKAATKRGAASKVGKARGAARRRVAAKKGTKRQGGSGREATLAQTPDTGRTVQGRTNPMPTKRSTGTPAGAGDSRRSPALDRERKRLREVDETVASPPSSLNPDRVHPSAARSGRSALQHAKKERTNTSPEMTGGDVDADWEDAYAVGDEAPGGDNPTPDQDRVDDIGRAIGIEYADNEELKGADKVIERDKHRWELDPASAEDYPDHEDE